MFRRTRTDDPSDRLQLPRLMEKRWTANAGGENTLAKVLRASCFPHPLPDHRFTTGSTDAAVQLSRGTDCNCAIDPRLARTNTLSKTFFGPFQDHEDGRAPPCTGNSTIQSCVTHVPGHGVTHVPGRSKPGNGSRAPGNGSRAPGNGRSIPTTSRSNPRARSHGPPPTTNDHPHADDLRPTCNGVPACSSSAPCKARGLRSAGRGGSPHLYEPGDNLLSRGYPIPSARTA